MFFFVKCMVCFRFTFHQDSNSARASINLRDSTYFAAIAGQGNVWLKYIAWYKPQNLIALKIKLTIEDII